jgi:hypothetical protein
VEEKATIPTSCAETSSSFIGSLMTGTRRFQGSRFSMGDGFRFHRWLRAGARAYAAGLPRIERESPVPVIMSYELSYWA